MLYYNIQCDIINREKCCDSWDITRLSSPSYFASIESLSDLSKETPLDLFMKSP